MTHLKTPTARPAANVSAGQAYASLLHIIQVGDMEVAQFVTPSGVSAVVATCVSNDLLTGLKSKLEGKLRRSGHLADALTKKHNAHRYQQG